MPPAGAGGHGGGDAGSVGGNSNSNSIQIQFKFKYYHLSPLSLLLFYNHCDLIVRSHLGSSSFASSHKDSFHRTIGITGLWQPSVHCHATLEFARALALALARAHVEVLELPPDPSRMAALGNAAEPTVGCR